MPAYIMPSAFYAPPHPVFECSESGPDKGLKGAASIPTDDLVLPNRHTRNNHSLAFQTPLTGTDIYKSSNFYQTITNLNSLTDSLISASECAEDSVTKFTSLVRASD